MSGVDVSAVLAELRALQTKLQGLQTSKDTPHDRDISKAMYLSGACPAPLHACDPDVEAKAGRTCPDVREYAPDPLIVDSAGRICYASEDLAKWAGRKNVNDIDSLIERAASELLMQLDSKGALAIVKEKLLEANVMDATKPRLLGTGACKVAADAACSEWSPQMVKDMNVDDVNAGLAEAVAMYKETGSNTANLWPPPTGVGMFTSGTDYVFHGWADPWALTGKATRSVGSVSDAYAKAVNPATLAYAGAYAWGKKADAMASRLGGEYEAKYLSRVQKLPGIVLKANLAVYNSGFTGKGAYPGLKNLTFDVAWPILMERTIGLNGLLRAAAATSDKSNLGVPADKFAAMTAREQWDMIIKQYKKFSRV